MADTYIDNSVISPNIDDKVTTQVDTYKRLSNLINQDNSIVPGIAVGLGNNFPETKQQLPKISIHDALSSDDPNVVNIGRKSLEAEMNQNPIYKYDLGKVISTPYDQGKKFLNKDYGFSALRDNEDFYYNNEYLKGNTYLRNGVVNPLRFLSRVAGGAIAKTGESLGYMGAMIGSIGSDNYLASVADNSFSKWFEEQEQSFKDNAIPIYKQAGFDDKGFFSKLGDWSFWNDSVADGVSFMVSAVAQSYMLGGASNLIGLGRVGEIGIGGLSKFGKVGKLGASTIKAFTGAEDLGGIGNWAFNTASESAFEMKGVFQEVKDKLNQERDKGLNDYTDLKIEEIAGKRAASDFKGNMVALSVSNAFENKFLFQPIKKFLKGSPDIEGKIAHTIENTADQNFLKATEKSYD